MSLHSTRLYMSVVGFPHVVSVDSSYHMFTAMLPRRTPPACTRTHALL